MILSPTSSVIPLATEVAAERRMYLPLLAVVVPVVVALGTWRKYVVPALVVIFGSLTLLRNADYQSEESIWRATVRHRSNNVRALVNLGTVVSRSESIGIYKQAVKLDPANAEAHYNLGINLVGERRLAEALPHLQRAAELSPRSPAANYRYGQALAEVGQLPAAETVVRRALELEPRSGKARKLLAAILAQQGRDLELEKDDK
jgi:Flp pilus assembly protein TadD